MEWLPKHDSVAPPEQKKEKPKEQDKHEEKASKSEGKDSAEAETKVGRQGDDGEKRLTDGTAGDHQEDKAR